MHQEMPPGIAPGRLPRDPGGGRGAAVPAADATGLVDLLTLKDGRVREVRILAVTREGVLYTLPGQTGRIRCLVELKRPDAVRRACDEAVRAMPGSPDVRALAANTLGDLALAQARGSAETVALKKALMHYLRVVILFGPDAGGPAGEHARALVQAGCCFDRLAGLQADSERRQAFRARARALFKDAAKEVSPSAAPWMERAKAALARDAS